MKKLNFNLIINITLIILIFSCNKKDLLEKYKNHTNGMKEFNNSDHNDEKNELYMNNLINLKNNYPFYIIRLKAPLYFKKPADYINIPGEYKLLEFGDIVFPVKEKSTVRNYFYVKTIDNKYGWINNNCGISVNYDIDPDLYFFGKDFYIKRYIESNGFIEDSNRIILAKNIVPLLLGNLKINNWFYPLDYNLALDISKLCINIAKDEKIFFYAASSVSYRKIDELIIAYNLLADSYQKLKFYNKTEEIHDFLIKRYFWRESYNSEIGGLTSVIKLEQIYLEQIEEEVINSSEYNYLKEKIIENILIVANEQKYNTWTAKDKKWKGLTFAEWLLDILRKSIGREEFYNICKSLSKRTTSEGFIDMINFYVAIEMYREGKKKEALDIINNYKPKSDYNFKIQFKMNDWLSANKIIPDSIIYQYKF